MPYTKGSKKNTDKREDSPEPGTSKKAKYSSDEDEQPVLRKGKCQSSKMISKQGKMSKKSPNVISKASGPQNSHNKPAELFRKDLISAMKMADTEILFDDEYLVISDPWRQEWEKGVQVPVNEEEIPPSVIGEVKKKSKTGDFKLPHRKFLHEKQDETYQATHHELTHMQELAEQIVRYDLDDQDVTWLELVNEDREEMGLQVINEWNMERMIEELENQCYVKTNALKKTEEGLGIEYDEDVACDVCHMLESEDTNEMVFCDGCDICVHQACYGIQTIPEGSWLCRICALGIKPMCLLCPKRGGAMKSTKSGTKWTHVSCALWIPEVSIGCPEKMEPITKISNIPPSRWALICSLCKERVGACIQCSVKQCKTAFHVTCGFAHNLDMKTIVDDSDDTDGIHLRAYCPKHTKNRNASDCESPKEEDPNDTQSEMEVTKKRQEKLQQIEEDFFNLVDVHEIADKFFVPEEAVDIVAEYWKLKRRVNNNKPLITPKMEEEDRMQKQQKDSLSARMKMFVHLRQDLERARNLCYMISKREKTKRQFFRLKEAVFHCQVQVLTDPDLNLSAREAEKIRLEYHFDSLYSNYGVLSARSSKQPRENLFNLHNLKTPKDYLEDERLSSEADKKVASSQSNLGKEVKVKTSRLSQGSLKDTTDDKVSAKARENLFSADSFNLTSDSAIESSEDESRPFSLSSTHSGQMSRLGKVRLKEIEEQPEDEQPSVIKAVPLSPPKKNFVATSDFGKKLSLFLLSKTKMQQQHERNHLERLGQALHVDVGHSDLEEVFSSDTNTDLLSPVDQQRNLFDHFGMKGKQFMSSLDTPQAQLKSPAPHRQHRKYKKRKHGQSLLKIKKLHLVTSPSDQAIPRSGLKTENDPCDTSAGTDDTKNISDQVPESDVTYHPEPTPKKRGRKKKVKIEVDAKPAVDKPIKLSPTPRGDAGSIYATLDGDIYVPSGKILVTERTIVLNDPKDEGKSRLKSKLRLKKQANSPVKGLASYMVVKDEDFGGHGGVEAESKQDAAEEKNIFDRVMDATPLRLDEADAKVKPTGNTKHNRKQTDSTVGRDTGETSFGSKLAKVSLESAVDKIEAPAVSKHNRKTEDRALKLNPSGDAGQLLTMTDEIKDIVKLESSAMSKNCMDKQENVDCIKSEKLSKSVRTRMHDSEKTEMSKNEEKSTFEISLKKKSIQDKPSDKTDKKSQAATPTAKGARGPFKKKPPSIQALPGKESSVEKVNTPKQDDRNKTNKDVLLKKTESHKGYNIRLKNKKQEPSDPEPCEEASAENFTPRRGTAKAAVKSPGARKSQSRLKVTEEVDENSSDDFVEESGNGVVLAKLPNKTHLNALLVASDLMVKVRKTAGDQLKHKLQLRGRWGSTNGVTKDRGQSTLDSFVKRTNISNIFSKLNVAHQETNGKNSCFSNFMNSELSPLRLNRSQPQTEPGFVGSLKHDRLAGSIFGSYSAPGGSLNNFSVLKKSDSEIHNKTPDNKAVEGHDKHVPVFGDVDRLTRQLSFEDISEKSTLGKTSLSEVVQTPSKCDLSELSEDKLDGHRSYRSHSPPSSEGSGISYLTSQVDSQLNTPSRRITRSCITEDSPSPNTRLRKRDSLIKAPQFNL
ncbi:Protein Jade-1 [Bulinus truncatus]|nr:Protein Jade-1 [Bulinus truncatus]